jgi:predicted ATPase
VGKEEIKTTLSDIMEIPVDTIHDYEICGRLAQGVEAGLLHVQGAGRYKFAHDSIHQSFLEAEVDSNFHTRAGFVILNLYRLGSSGRSWMLFAAMEVLNPVAHTLPDESSRLTLIQLNLQAAWKAVDRAAFFPAAEYLTVAIKLATQSLENAWISRYVTMLKLYSMAAMVESVCGRHVLCASLASVVFNNAVDAEDKIEAYFAVISSLQGQAKFEEAIKVNMDALMELGEKVHRKTGRLILIFAARKTRKIVGSKSEDDIISLPSISDPKTKKKFRLLNTLFLNSYYCRTGPFSTPAWMHLTVMRLLRSTVELGRSQYSPTAFAAYAQILVNAGNVSEGCAYGSIAMKLIEKSINRENLPVATFFLATTVTHIRKPMYQTLTALNLGYQVGMEVGEAHGAFLCASTLVAYKNAIGSPLNEIMQQCESMCK